MKLRTVVCEICGEIERKTNHKQIYCKWHGQIIRECKKEKKAARIAELKAKYAKQD